MIKMKNLQKLFNSTATFVIVFLITSTAANLIYLGRNTGKAAGSEGWTGQPDFKVFWIAARSLTRRMAYLRETQGHERKNENEILSRYPVYDKSESFYHFRYSPTVAFLMIPFGKICHPRSALFWWSVLLTFVFLAALLLLRRQISLDFALTDSEKALVLWGAFLATLRYYLMILGQGQTDVFAALFFVLFLMAYMREKEVFAGVMLALILQIKLFFLPVLFYFLIRRKIKLVVSSIVTFAAFLALPCFVAGCGETILLLKDWKWILNTSIPSQLLNVKNQSVSTFLSGLLLKADFINRFFSAETLAYFTAMTLTVLFYFALARYSKFTRAEGEKKYKYLEISLLIISAVVFSPIAWQAYFVNLIIPFAFTIYLLTASGKRSVACACLAIYFILSCMVGTDITKFIPGVNSLHFINITLGTVFLVFAMMYSYRQAQVK